MRCEGEGEPIRAAQTDAGKRPISETEKRRPTSHRAEGDELGM